MDIYTIRSTFINFFKEKGHAHIPAVPIVNQEDPDLLFVNAGMNPFKDIFLGNQSPHHTKIVNSQPCLRVTGKHNDLDEVGIDTYHHTLFEMLGNWSFNSYFKKEAIDWAWELLIQVYSIEPSRLYVTVFEGEQSEGLTSDSEAYELWKKHLPEKCILYGNKKDNFWEMGATGPCGPCTEIHIDLRSDKERQHIPGSDLVNKNDPQVIELWNIVFIQYNRSASTKLSFLPTRHVDTGMGLERLAMVLQNKQSTYETDAFMPLIEAIAQKAHTVYGKNKITDIALRVIADHTRTITFAIADGAIPSNQKAGYVIRRILRRALRYGYNHLNLKQPFLHELAPKVTHSLSKAYPSLQKQQNLIQKTLYQEELSFLQTLSQGLKRLAYITKNLSTKFATIQGEIVFELYDTYGFPPDLTALIAREQGLAIDEKGFEQCMEQQKVRSKKASDLHQGEWHVIHNNLASTFAGYDDLTTTSYLIKYRTVQKKHKTYYQLVLDKTPFYAEAGGQVGDTGYLIAEGQKIRIFDTQKENNLIVHYTTELPNNLQNTLVATVDKKRRENISNNHTATHLLLATICKTLGKHITQQGSLVHEKGLRFDFTHNEKILPATIQKIEELVNQTIRTNLPLNEVRNMPIHQAKKMGATATFGEKYGEEVRVVTYGGYCSDLCGGTHAQATGQIGFFKIKTEKSISAGIRRIEAITGSEAEQWVQSQQATLAKVGEQLKNTQDPVKAAEQLTANYKALKQHFEKLSHKALLQEQKRLQQKIQYIDNTHVAIEKVNVESIESLKKLAFSLNKANQPSFIVLATILENKPHIIITISPQLNSRYRAQHIIKALSPYIQGKGGGQAHFALASGQHVEGLAKVLQTAKDIFEKKS